MSIASRFGTVAAFLALSCLVCEAQSDTVDDFVRAEMAGEKVPGLAVAIIERGEVTKATGYGLANVELGVPVGPETVFQSGSLGKQFTAAVVMTLVEEGHIALTDPVTRYFPEAPESWRPITVRHLLTHTSGIPDFTEATVDLRRDYTEDELAKLAFGLQLEFPAGARWNYSNTGYVLLGILIQRASGRFYGDLLRERVFVPAGMQTARVISEADIVPNRAAGYRLVDGELKNQEWLAPSLNTTADGSLYFSILDLVAWDRALRCKAILRPESWEQVFAPVTLNSGKSYPYGFGWRIAEVAGQTVYRHDGAWQGFRSQISRYLGDDLTIVVLANLAEAKPDRFVDGIAAILDPKLASPEPKPIPDREPEVADRLRELLAAASEGKLNPQEFAYVRAGFFPDRAAAYQKLLAGLGRPQRVELLERRELGDDRYYRYDVTFAGKTLRVTLALAPDDEIAELGIQPR